MRHYRYAAAAPEVPWRTLLAAEDPAKAEKAMMANMVHWCKSQGCSTDALLASGTARKEYMLKYVVWQMQDKKATCSKLSGHIYMGPCFADRIESLIGAPTQETLIRWGATGQTGGPREVHILVVSE